MKQLIAVAFLAAVALADRDYVTMFKAFKAKHAKVYPTEAEETKRFEAFTHNMKRAAVAQAANPLATFGPNALSDITDEELKNRHRHTSARFNAEERGQKSVAVMTEAEKSSARGGSVDWRTKGAVGPVLNQGNCNWNWAISAVGNIEGVWAASGKKFVSASVQELVSCDNTATGCNNDFGSDPSVGFEWLIQNTNGTIATAASLPLNSDTPNCPPNLSSLPVAATISGYVNITQTEDDIAAYTLLHGPISVVAYVTGFSWNTYNGGILTDCSARVFEDFYNAVLVVGYDDTHNPPYWILKNSWGADWGEEGYIRIQKGVNLCSIAQTASSVIIN